MDDKIAIGKIIKPHGIKNECILYYYSKEFNQEKYDTYFMFLRKEWVPIHFKVLGIYKNNISFYRIIIEGYYDRTGIEKELLEKEIFVENLNYKALREDEFFYKDVIGVDVYKEEEKIGKVMAVHNFGSNDLIEVKVFEIITEEAALEKETIKEKIIFLPLQKDFLKEMDLEHQKIVFYREIDGFL